MVGFAALVVVFLGLVLVARMVPPPGADPAVALELPARTDAPGSLVGADRPEAEADAEAEAEAAPSLEEGAGDEAADGSPAWGTARAVPELGLTAPMGLPARTSTPTGGMSWRSSTLVVHRSW